MEDNTILIFIFSWEKWKVEMLLICPNYRITFTFHRVLSVCVCVCVCVCVWWGTKETSECILKNIESSTSIPDFPGASDGKASVYNAGDLGLIPGWGRTRGEGNGNPLQYYCLENRMDRGAW